MTILVKLYGGIYALIIPMGLIVLWIAVRMIFPIKRKAKPKARLTARVEGSVFRLDETEIKISE